MILCLWNPPSSTAFEIDVLNLEYFLGVNPLVPNLNSAS